MATPLYSTSFNITQFSGLNQTGDGYNMNMQYAREIENVNVAGGSYQPMREGLPIDQVLESAIGTLCYLHRRFGANAGTTMLAAFTLEQPENMGGLWAVGVYTKQLDGADDWEFARYLSTTYLNHQRKYADFDWVTYEVNTYPEYSASKPYALNARCSHGGSNYKCTTAIGNAGEAWNAAHWEEVGADPVDVLLFTNSSAGMYCMYGDDLSVIRVTTPANFGVIARYNERIWGAGIEEDPDKLIYSAPYDPFDWEQNTTIPEDGAGDILLPTWDGDRFMALRQFGSSLLAVKRNSLWRVYGTEPSEFSIQQQYGGGTIEEDSLQVYGNYAYMLGEHGLMRYDGVSVTPFLQEAVHVLMNEQVNRDAIDQTCAAMRNGVYCLALPINGSSFCNAVLEYNTLEGTLALRTQISVESFMSFNERLFYTSATDPGRVYEMRDDVGKALFSRWISGYQDLGLKNSIKSAFIVYMTVDTEVPFELRVGIRTEKKLKQKTVAVKPGKILRLHLNLTGRIFRLEIQSYSAAPFQISGGVRVDLELDPD